MLNISLEANKVMCFAKVLTQVINYFTSAEVLNSQALFQSRGLSQQTFIYEYAHKYAMLFIWDKPTPTRLYPMSVIKVSIKG